MQPLGIKKFSDTVLTGGRGGEDLAGIPFFVNGNSLFSISVTGAITNHGFITGSERVSIAKSSRHLVIVVPGKAAYVFDNQTNLLNQITSSSFITSDSVTFKDTFFFFTSSDGKFIFHSELNDPLDFNALDFGTSEINPDPIITGHANHNEYFALNLETIEIFQNIGGNGFVLQRIPGANIQKGCHAKFSPVEFDNTFCFVGGDKNEKTGIWKVTSSSSAIKISTDAIDTKIQEFTREEIAKSFSMSLSERGQTLALFTFESVRIPSRTFVYNATASALSGSHVWFEFQSGFGENNFQVASIVSAYDKLLVSDLKTSFIGEFDRKTLDYYGDPIERRAASEPFNREGLPVFAGALEVNFQGGVGLTSGQGSDPKVRMRFSDDEGHTFSNEFKRDLGKKGKFKKKQVWQRQGRFPVERTIEFIVTDRVEANLIRLSADAEPGSQ
jgi:hypothetical protein